MEETTTAQAIEPEAPPGDTQPVVAVAPFEADHASELRDDYSNLDAIIEAARAAAEADTGDEPDVVTAAETPPPTVPVEPPVVPKPSEPDYAAILADLQAKGYKVEAPAPPPDPYQQLVADLVTERGTDQEYAEVRRQATVKLAAEPTAYDAESVSQHETAVRARNEASDKLERMDQARRITDQAIRFGRDRALGEIGSAFSALPETYQLSPVRAQRVTAPQSATDAIAAIVEQVSERYEAKLAEREKHWQGEVARASSDRSAAAVERMGRAPQATSVPGGKPATGPFSTLLDQQGRVTDDVIERAKRGELAGLNLTG